MSGTAGVASLQMAGAAHALPVVIQYVLYNSREQQALSWCMEQQHVRIQLFITESKHMHPPCIYTNRGSFTKHTVRPPSHPAC